MYDGAYYLTCCFSSFILFIFTSTPLRGSLVYTCQRDIILLQSAKLFVYFWCAPGTLEGRKLEISTRKFRPHC